MASIIYCLVILLGQVLASENDIDDGNRRVVLVGTKLKLPCTPPDAEDILDYFTWTKNGILLPDRYSSTALQSRFIIQTDFSLLIEEVAEDDEGNYSCNVQSEPPRTTNYSVQVEVPATIDQLLHHGQSPHYQLREGGNLDLICLARGRPLPTVTWKYQGKILSAEESIVDVNQKVSSLHRIVNARRLNAGAYLCEADNGVALPAVVAFNVEVSHAPEIVVVESWVHTGLGSLTELACTVYAQPPAQMTWYQSNYNTDGEKQLDQVLPSNRIGTLVMTNGLKHVLRFNSVRDSDLGVYTCRAENPLGRAEAAVEMSGKARAAYLWVTPPRDKFNLENEDKGKITYRLKWEVESQSPIFEYRLWLRPRGKPETDWVNVIIPYNTSTGSASSSHSHDYELSGLDTGVYQISVQSRNQFGWSAESNAVSLSGKEDPELDLENDYKSSSSNSPTTSTTTTTTTTTTATPISSTLLNSVTIQLEIEVSGSTVPSGSIESIESTGETQPLETISTDQEEMEDNQSTLPALIIDPVSVQQHGTHQELQTTTMDPPTQAASQSTDSAECQDCDQETPSTSKDPANLPSSIVSPGNSCSRPTFRFLTVLLVVFGLIF